MTAIKLKAVKPEKVDLAKPKFMISGKSGVGKTMFALDFPGIYFIDAEGGATRPQYREKMLKNGAGYMGKDQGSQDFKTVIDEIKMLGTTKHAYKTLVIDSFSYLYNLAAAIAEEKIGNDFGRDKKEANKPTRQLIRWIENLDMNVILICHSKDKWTRKGTEIICEGTTFDGFDKMEYILDLWIEIEKRGTKRFFIVKKSRINAFPEGEIFPLEYSKFSELYGKEVIEKQGQPSEMASEDQVKELRRIIDALKLPEATTDTWLEKAGVFSFEEFTAEQITKCLEFVTSQIKGEKQNGQRDN